MTETMVRLIGSEWNGSRLPAPKREIPGYGVNLKLRGKNFRVKPEGDELVAYFQGERENDLVVGGPDVIGADGKARPARRYDVCPQCNYDRHQCPGCGAGLSHDGINLSGPRRGFPHGTECVE